MATYLLIIIAFITLLLSLFKKDKTFKTNEMKQVEINGNLIEFTVMEEGNTLKENVDPRFIGYSKVYFVNGNRHELEKPAKFFR